MALFEKLKDTKLKSLKFGEKGTKGDSTKPYIVTDINTVDTPFNKFRLTTFDDGLIRGGVVGATNASVVDTLRIGKFLTDSTKGPLFIAKQVGLQLSNSPVETKQLATNRVGKGILGKVVAGAANAFNKLNNLVGGPTRIYNLGINTLAQVPLNAFGGHIARHGFLPKLDDSQKYESVVTSNNTVVNEGNKISSNNRLVTLYSNFFQSNSSGTTFRANVFNKTISDNFGGASSVYGIGRTTLHRTTITGREFDITPSTNKEVLKDIQQGVSEHVYDVNTIYQQYKAKYDSEAEQEKFKQSKILYTVKSAISRINTKTNYGSIDIDKTTEPTSSFQRKFKLSDPTNFEKATPILTYLDRDPSDALYVQRKDIPKPRNINTTFDRNITEYHISGSNTHSSIINPSSSYNTIFKKFRRDYYDEDINLEKFKYKQQTTSDEDIQISKTKSSNVVKSIKLTSYANEDRVSNQFAYTSFKIDNYIGESPASKINRVDGEYNVGEEGVSDRLFPDTPLDFIADGLYKNRYKPQTSNKKYNNLLTNQILKTPFTFPYNYNSLYAEPLTGSDGKPLPNQPQLDTVGVGKIKDAQYVLSDTYIIRNPLGNNRLSNNPIDYDYGIISMKDNVYQRDDHKNFNISFTQLDPFTGTKLNPIVFTGYITGYSENYDSNWESIKYNGRSEFLYTFNTYKKTATFKLKLPSFAYTQIKENHDKLKNVEAGLVGTYKNNRLGGVINYVSLGYYLSNVPCIITSMAVSIPDEAGWDLDTKQSMLLEATFNLIVLGENNAGLDVNVVKATPAPTLPPPTPTPTPVPIIPTTPPTTPKPPPPPTPTPTPLPKKKTTPTPTPTKKVVHKKKTHGRRKYEPPVIDIDKTRVENNNDDLRTRPKIIPNKKTPEQIAKDKALAEKLSTKK